MMKANTIPDVVYSVTAPAGESCNVTATVNGTSYSLAGLVDGGQCRFQAVAGGVEVSSPRAIVRPVPMLPEAGASASQVAQMVDSVLFEDVPFGLSTPEGVNNAMAQYVELDAQHVPQGRLASIGFRGRSSGNPSTCSYLGVWEQAEGSDDVWVYLGSSLNAPGQSAGTTQVWEFGDGVALSGRKVRLLAQESRSEVWVEGPQLGVRTSAMPEGDETKVVNNGRRYSYLPEVVMTVRQAVARFAALSHVDDAGVHVSADDRARWDAAAECGTVSGDYAAASHVGDATHLQRDGRLLRLLDSSGGTALQLQGNTTNATLTAGSLYNNVPDWSLNTVAAAIYDYEMSTGVTDVWFAATTSAAALAPLGIYTAGVHIGNSHYPVRLQGSEVSVNGVPLDAAALAQLIEHKDELLALLAVG